MSLVQAFSIFFAAQVLHSREASLHKQLYKRSILNGGHPAHFLEG